jgi:Arylsulfotransferase (ASST)
MRFRHCAKWLMTVPVLVAPSSGVVTCCVHPAQAALVSVSVFPVPGSRYNRPVTQIAFRGVSPDAIGHVRVVGSRSGVHIGRVEADSDGQGASFLPYKPFAPGETVTVSTRLDVLGAASGRFTFAIAHVVPLIPNGTLSDVPRAYPYGVMHFRSEPGLEPASLTVTDDAAPASEGDIFVAPQNGPIQNGPMIVDPAGQLVWFRPYPVAKNVFVNDFRVQDLYGQAVLTWWQGFRNAGFGQSRGVGVIVNSDYQKIATVRAADGLDAGSHEFLVTPDGDAYITASSPVLLPGHRVPAIDSVVQEIDIKTGLVLFEWHALDHVPLSASVTSEGSWFDPYHVNSISVGSDGNLLVSMRNTSAVYEIDHRSGRVLWTLGGKGSSFVMGPGTSTYLQHDAVVQPDGTVTIFDNGGGLPFLHPQSRGIHERLDLNTMTVTLISEYDHSPSLRAVVEGGMQVLPDGDAVIGWGSDPAFSESNAGGQQILDAHFNEPITSYRAYRFAWSAQPWTAPALVVSGSTGGTTRLYVSWNGATDVSAWQVLGGPTSRALRPVETAPKTGFETVISLHGTDRYFAAQALDIDGRVLSTSRTIPLDHRRRARG